MANNFQIDVTAADKTKPIIGKVTKALASLGGRSSREIDKGFDKVGDTLADAARKAGGLADNLARAASPAQTIFGAASLAGLAAFSAQWGKAGQHVAAVSFRTGIAARRLQGLTKGAERLGVAGASVEASLAGLANARQDALFGRNTDAVLLARQLGLDLTKSTEELFPQILRKLKGLAPGARQHFASILGIDANELALLIENVDKYKNAVDAANGSGSVLTSKGLTEAKELNLAFVSLTQSVEGVGNAFLEEWAPVITPALKESAHWIEQNRTLVGNLTSALTALLAIKPALWLLRLLGISGAASAAAPFAAPVAGVAALGAGAYLAAKDPELTSLLVARSAATEAGLDTSEYDKAIEELKAKRKADGSQAQSGAGASAASVTLGIRQNNPGNLRRAGDAPIVNGYAQFPTAREGLAALTGQLQRYGRRGLNTLDSIIPTYSPAADGNNVEAYVQDVSGETGFARDQKLDLNDPKTLALLDSAIIKHENGGNPYSPEQIAAAVQDRLGRGTAGTEGKVDVNVRLTQDGRVRSITASSSGSHIRPTIESPLPTGYAP